MFGLGYQELMIILVIVLLLFGAQKLPELARGLGKSMSEFKKGQNEDERSRPRRPTRRRRAPERLLTRPSRPPRFTLPPSTIDRHPHDLPLSGFAPGSRGAMPRADWALALAIAGLTLATRWPYRVRLLPTWDAVQFALALERYDVVRHQPHPPGYILYVALGRLAERGAGGPRRDPRRSGRRRECGRGAPPLPARVAPLRPRRRHAGRARARREPAVLGVRRGRSRPTPPRPRSPPGIAVGAWAMRRGSVGALVSSAVLLGSGGRGAPVDAAAPEPALARHGVARIPAARARPCRSRPRAAHDDGLARADAVADGRRSLSRRQPRALRVDGPRHHPPRGWLDPEPRAVWARPSSSGSVSSCRFWRGGCARGAGPPRPGR